MSEDTAWIVLKFGGTSVGSAEHWPTIAQAIEACQEEGARPFVVCSALSGVSNLLEQLLNAHETGESTAAYLDKLERRHTTFGAALGVEVSGLVAGMRKRLLAILEQAGPSGPVSARWRAEVMALGELMSTQMGAQWLRQHGFSVAWQDARRLLSANPSLPGAGEHQQYLSATCPYEEDDELREALASRAEDVVLTQGFIARDLEGHTVLLGRGGSDTAAAYFAAKLGARRLEIWTDVPGVFTANPQQIPQARLLKTLSYDEAETLAGMGAKVLHPPCIQPVRDAAVPLHIRWTSDPQVQGTVITAATTSASQGIKAVSARNNLCLISMERRAGWQPVGFMADVASCFKQHALSMDMLSSSPWNIQTTLDLSAGSGIAEQVPELLRDLEGVCQPTAEFEVASVSLVGHGMRACLHHWGSMLELLRERQLLMLTPSGNDLTFSFVVPSGERDVLLRMLHAALFEDAELEAPFGPSWEELTGELEEAAAEPCLEEESCLEVAAISQ